VKVKKNSRIVDNPVFCLLPPVDLFGVDEVEAVVIDEDKHGKDSTARVYGDSFSEVRLKHGAVLVGLEVPA
jgi:hypothetical protein